MYTLQDFKNVREELSEIIEKFPKENINEIFYGNWTIKEVIGHISAWDKYFANVLENILKGKKSKHWGNINIFNEKETTKRKNWSYKKLLKESIKTGESFIKTYTKLNTALLSKTIWDKKKYSPVDLLKIQIHHYESQIKQIDKRV